MQAFKTSIPPTIFETFPRAITSTSRAATATSPQATQAHRQFHPTPRPHIQQTYAVMSSAAGFSQYKIQTTTIPTAPDVQLSDPQKVITGSILDLFSGHPSLRKLSLWKDDAVFSDPLTIAEGRKQYAPQWYGLPAVFSNIERLDGQVTSGGNPIEMNLKTRYTVKGIGSQQTIESKIKIWTEGEGNDMRIKRVEDRWNDKLPEGAFKNAMRNLNSVVVPTLVSVPKSIEEEEKGS